ncbi:MAG: 1-(5-phosphoribosyl)-5-[(5-phosphoribosylamino)methylideneamino]imidazole-4-carboxamide isomerase [Piscirickettsiaceae bacterium]|nr:1-(5-phosphoribosyl)-5-[(5-phosphoribosylamino)methylideneamino]imidazole-4-carboxamide isomerase [Piscirickettsiaceae bacterium]
MLLIPAIDLKKGQCVRLRQGRMEDSTVFSSDPLAMAKKWLKAGAKRLHIVDLDGALSGKPVHKKIIKQICTNFPDIDVQVGGGIGDEDTVQDYIEAGARYVIIGTKAINSPDIIDNICAKFPGHIVIALDAKDGKAATDGWSNISHYKVIDIAKHLNPINIEAIIYTDISRDGMMQGVNLSSTRNLAREIKIPVIASGGINSYDDIIKLCRYESEGITGAVIGRAIYEGVIDLAKGQHLANHHTSTA